MIVCGTGGASEPERETAVRCLPGESSERGSEGELMLGCFSTLCIVIIKDRGTTVRRLAELTEVQRQLLRYLGIPPNRLAFLEEDAAASPCESAGQTCCSGCGT